ncbi:MAG: trypsin-like peptidase domain-containing protein [Planctomycetes bacterium]|nr:trypsin-like peptidase domain-containing protein [Planctomycetota bacterium]
MKKTIPLTALGFILLYLGAGLVHVPLQIGSPLAAQSKTHAGELADPLAQLSERFESVAARVSPAVVSVEAVKPPKANTGGNGNGKSKPVEESGSGVIVKLDAKPGYFVVTNNHVVSQARTDQITIHLADGRLFRPGQVWSDPETDIALLSLDGAVNLPTAALGNSDHTRAGRWVLAIGSPFGLNQSVTHGIISARDRGQVSLGSTIRIKEFLQTDAAINPGSSGGPLLDLNGDVIGINTAIASHNGSNSGVSFSIPINLVKRVLSQMLQGSVQRGYLGMQLATSLEPKDALRVGLDRVQGALVEKVFPQTPAAEAGLQADDVILQIDTVAVRTENHLINLIAGLPSGQRVRLQVWRNRSLVTLDAVVGDWAKAQTRFQ